MGAAIANWIRLRAASISGQVPTRGLLHAFRRDRDGVAAVEFALAATPMMMLLFSFIAVNLVFYTMTVMQNQAQYAAMAVASKLVNNNAAGTFVAHSSSGPTLCSAASVTATTAEYYACGGLPSWANFSVSTTEACGGNVPTITITITVSAAAAALADVADVFLGKTLSTSSVAMMQGTCP